MFDRLKLFVLAFARVPPEPHAPAGSPGSIRVFRAGENYWKYRLVVWTVRQVAALFFIVVFINFTGSWVEGAQRQIAAAQAPAAPGKRPPRIAALHQVLFWAKVVHGLEWIGLATLVTQLPFSFAAARLDYEMRWYIVTDRSLRIREGIFGVREMTLTYANVQNIAMRQGPLQRLLGLADVVVRTAGGGSGLEHGKSGSAAGEAMHVGTLRAVDRAEEVRDLILDRLRRFKDAGLGDPDDRRHVGPAHETEIEATLRAAGEVRDAARLLAAEARALTRARGPGPR